MASVASYNRNKLKTQLPTQPVVDKESSTARRRRMLDMILKSENSRKTPKEAAAS